MLDRQTNETRALSNSFGFDATGNVIGKIWPNGKSVVIRFDDLNRVTQENFGGEVIHNHSYGSTAAIAVERA